MAVVRISQSDARRLNQQAQLVGLRWRDLGRSGGRLPKQYFGLIGGDDRLVRRAVRKAHSTLVTGANWTHGLKQDRFWEMARQLDPLPDWEIPSRATLAPSFDTRHGETLPPVQQRGHSSGRFASEPNLTPRLAREFRR